VSLPVSAQETRGPGVVLFVDFNNAPREVSAAREAAARRGDRLVVLPNLSGEVRGEYDRLLLQIPRLEQQLVALGGRNARTAARFDELSRTLQQAREQRSRLRRQNEITPQAIRTALTAIQQSGDRLETLILSGHSSGRSYFGDFGDLNTDELQTLLAPTSGQPSTLQSLYLWGCYTNTLSETLDWRARFPQLQMILGFDGKAPSSELPASYEMLADAMAKEERIRAARSALEVTRQFRTLRHSLITHSSLTVGSCHVSAENPKDPVSLSQAENCQRTVETLLTLSEASYNRYKAATRGTAFENPPANPGQGILRAFYNELQRHYHCVTLLNREQQLPSREQVLRLIFFENMRQHFNQAYRVELEELNAWLSQLRPPTELRYPGLPPRTASRADVLEFISDLGSVVYDNSPPEALSRFLRNELILSLRALRCMPLTWVEPLRNGEPVPKPRACADL